MLIQVWIKKTISITMILSILLGMLPPVLAAAAPGSMGVNAAADSAQFRATQLALTSDSAPDVLTNPVSISRVQSSYTAGTTVISFTVTNNLPPTRYPELTGSETLTDTIDIFANFDLTADANTLRSPVLETTLTAGTSFLDASGSPSQNGSTLTWDLSDLPPQATETLTLTLQTPAAGPNFIDLDTGPQLNADLWDGSVAASAPPAVIVPSTIAAELTMATPDADSFDAEMLWVSASLGQDPLAMFAYVQSLGYDPYKGSLRGTRGTLWGEAGNSVDQASLLIAMLRAGGVPARYRHGTLSTGTAQTLLAGMFPDVPGLAGHVPAGSDVADPINDLVLQALVQDHWWVEAYLPGSGWTDLDPSFPDANPGDTFVSSFATDGTDGIAELPDDVRHTITLNLKVEQYSEFPIGGSNLVEIYPLDLTLPTAQLAAKRLTFAHFVASEAAGGVFANVIHTYTPYFAIEANNIAYEGDPFQDLLSNFPLSTVYTTAEWIEYTLEDPDGNQETFARTVTDRIGIENRLNGGALSLTADGDAPPFALLDDTYVNWVLPNTVPDWVRERQILSAVPRMVDIAQHAEAMQDLANTLDPNATLNSEQAALFSAARSQIIFTNERLLTDIGLNYAWTSDKTLANIETGLQTKLFYDTPRVFTVATVGDPLETITATVDLRRTTAQSLVYPGQAEEAALSAQWTKGLAESYLEGQALESAFGEAPVTTWRVFDEMEVQGIGPVLLTPDEIDMLDIYPFSAAAQAHIATALQAGKSVLVPSEPVDIDGETTFSWWETDPATGETVSVGEDGLRPAALPYRLVLIVVESFIEVYAGNGGGVSPPGAVSVAESAMIIGEKVANMFLTLLAEWEAATTRSSQSFAAAQDTAAEFTSSIWRYQPAHRCPVPNCGLGQFILDGLASGPIPLPDIAFVEALSDTGSDIGRAEIFVTDSHPSGAPTFNLDASPDSSSTTAGTGINFQADITSNFSDDFTLMVYGPPNWTVAVDSVGSVTIDPATGAQPDDYTIQLVAQPDLHPDLVETAVHTVTIQAVEAMDLMMVSEPDITVPMGVADFSAVSNQTNDREAEVPVAAYTLILSNEASTAHTYDLTVSGPPSDWVVLNGDMATGSSVDLGPGDTARIGLYLQAPVGAVPSPGTSYPINVTATASDNAALTDSVGATFTMPGQAFNYLTLDAPALFVGADGDVDFELEMENVGNTAGDFPITAESPLAGVSVTGLPTSVNLGTGASTTETGNLAVSGLTPGMRFPLEIGSPAPGSYTQYVVAEINVISELTEPVFIAGEQFGNVCTLGEPGLAAATESLAFTMVQLENSCNAGACDDFLQGQVVAAVETLANYAGAISSLIAADTSLNNLAATLASRSDDAEILTDLAAISTAVTDLEAEVCELSEHLPELSWDPAYEAVLPGGVMTFTLDLTNRGSVTTTYTLTLDLPAGNQVQTPTVNPGETISFDYPVSAAATGLYDLDAAAQANAPDVTLPDLTVEAAARLNVVDRFIQLTAVMLDPAFVETGTSATTIHADINNVANVAREATARTSIHAPGGALTYTADVPLTVLVGAPRTYTLNNVDTSGWAEGVYTVTVDILDDTLTLIPDGSNYGYLTVGQGLGIEHGVTPEIGAPGTLTVTTQLTTSLLSESIFSEGNPSNQDEGENQESENRRITDPLEDDSLILDSAILDSEVLNNPREADLIQSTWAITRTEDSDPAVIYAGTWVTVTNLLFSDQSSNGDHTYSSNAGDTATFSFNGTWVHIGFNSDQRSGEAEILIDGVSYGVVDLYSREANSNADIASFVYDGLADIAHTLTISVTGNSNPLAVGTRVGLDFIDTWDGTDMDAGSYEEDSPRVWYSAGWDFLSDPAASGGGYADSAFQGNNTAWFPFTGDSFTYQAVAHNVAGVARLFVDGEALTTLDLYSADPITETYSFDGFGPGPHVVTVRDFLYDVSIDRFISPGAAPFYEEPVYTGIVRYEEYHPAIKYNGEDYFHRPRNWTAGTTGGTSGLGDVSSSTLSDTISLTFDGRWVNLGFRAGTNRGQAEVSIDGVSQGVIGLYAPSETLQSFQFGGLLTGTHTLTLTILGQPDPPSTGSAIYFDYIDVWDGTDLPDDYINARRADPSGRLHYSAGGGDVEDEDAYQGDYVAPGLPNSNFNVWYAFTGDSFTYIAFSRTSGGVSEVYVDDVLVDTVDHTYPFAQQPLTFHYTGLSDGPHLVRVKNVNSMRVDAFASNPETLANFQPQVEWWETDRTGGGSIWGGLHVPVAVGDVTGDGNVELVVVSSNIDNNGELFLMRGDGSDTGDGDPIIWSIPYNIFNGFEDVGAPTIAELDGEPGAEIIHATIEGVYAYHSDGSTYWMTDTLQSHVFFAAPAAGNLDLDPEPEIVINLSDSLVVFESDGSVAWEVPTVGTPSMPLLADLTHDGLLDILFHNNNNLYLYDYNYSSPTLAWTQTFTMPLGVYGAPAVADIDGLQPGGDPGPEIGITSEGRLHVLDEDGTFLQTITLDDGSPGGVSVADVDGDGEIEMITTMWYNGGRIYAVNPDGSVLWDVEALDNSPLTASVMDLEGDGIYEVAWNGATGGFTLFNGADGTVLFNDDHPQVISKTGSDYPVFADVDLDGYAEIVVASQAGVRVFGYDTAWGPARPVWNQHSYHITNINDDLSVPQSEANSWEIHNTYRTQTPLTNPMPSHDIVLTHTVGLMDQTVLTGTFNVGPDLSADPVYSWSYQQTGAEPVVTRTFQSRLENLVPGESRMIAQGTEVYYTLPGGSNRITLPPLYVDIPHLVGIDPAVQTVGAGATAVYTLTVTNPGPTTTSYTLTVVGVPSEWVALATNVNVPGGSTVEVPLVVAVPPGAGAMVYDLSVGVSDDQGGADQATAILDVLGPLVEISVDPPQQEAPTGTVLTYTLTISNYEGLQRTYDLTATGFADVTLPPTVNVAGGGVETLSFTAEAVTAGDNPFNVIASTSAAADETFAIATGLGISQVGVSFDPATAAGGPGMPTEFDVTITNLGDLVETYDLSVEVPAGWDYTLMRNGSTITETTLFPAPFNSIELALVVTPDTAAAPGDYPVTVRAESQAGGSARVVDALLSAGTGTGTVQVGVQGVRVAFLSGSESLTPAESGAWTVQVTNTGSQADSFDLSGFGIIAQTAQFNPSTVSLAAGASQNVQVTVGPLENALARDYLIGVLAESQSNSDIAAQDTWSLTVETYEAVSVNWRPSYQVISGTLSTGFTLDVTNAGNVPTVYAFELIGSPGVTVTFGTPPLAIPSHGTISLFVPVTAAGDGQYTLTGTASAGSVQDSAIATLTVGEVTYYKYLPMILKE